MLADTAYAVLRRWPLLRYLASAEGTGSVDSGDANRRLAVLAWQGDPAILRSALTDDECRWLDRAERIDVDTLDESLHHNLPPWLAERMQSLLGDEFWPWLRSTQQPAPLDLRVNTAKTSRKDPAGPAARRGHRRGAHAVFADRHSRRRQAVPHEAGSLRARRIRSAGRGQPVAGAARRRAPRRDGGRFLCRSRRQDAGARRADAWHRAGSTPSTPRAIGSPPCNRASTEAVSALSIRYRSRHERDERIARLAGKADRVLVDAPCTGLGTLRRHPDLKWRQSPESLAAFGRTQPRILAAAAALVRDGGRLGVRHLQPAGRGERSGGVAVRCGSCHTLQTPAGARPAAKKPAWTTRRR